MKDERDMYYLIKNVDAEAVAYILRELKSELSLKTLEELCGCLLDLADTPDIFISDASALEVMVLYSLHCIGSYDPAGKCDFPKQFVKFVHMCYAAKEGGEVFVD